MKSSGVSRFLSRRDKHHEKRSSKGANSKVSRHSFASSSPSTPLLSIVDGASMQEQLCHQRRHSSNLEALYHKLSPVLRSSVHDGLLFFQRNTPSHVLSPNIAVQVSRNPSSNTQLVQTRQSQPVPSDLYKIFTNEDQQTTADKDAEKKVGSQHLCCHTIWLTGNRSRCSSLAFSVLA